MRKVATGHEIIRLFEQFSPKHLAVEGDKIGLQIGSLHKEVHNVMIVLDLVESVIEEAIKGKVDLIIAHHPPIYRPLKTIHTDTPFGKIVEKCIKHDIAVYAAHTNLDVTAGGVNDMLAEALELTNTKVLSTTYEDKLKKLIVYAPKQAAEGICEALGMAGAGHIGNYSHCMFSSEGIGTFLPSNESKPFIGTAGKLESVEEIKIETVFPSSIHTQVIAAMHKAHPYEEVAYDIFPLEIAGELLGLGRIGELVEEMTVEQFAYFVKEKLKLTAVRVVGNLEHVVKKVAVLGGDGNKYIVDAKQKEADVFITGDIYYHVAHDAKMMGLNIVDAGHHIEQIMKSGVAEKLTKLADENNIAVNVFASKHNTDPFTYL